MRSCILSKFKLLTKEVPASIKVAVTTGAILGASIAALSNKEAILKTAEGLLQRGADLCRSKLDEMKEGEIFAESHADNAFSSYDSDNQSDRSSGVSTPASESDTELLLSSSEASDVDDFDEVMSLD